MNAKFTIEGAEETIKLLDKASSLINELRSTIYALSSEIPGYPETSFKENAANEEDSH